jgi:hypothetical protein
MTNDTIDQDARVTQAAIARLPGHAAVGTDLDAARMRIMRTLCLRANIRIAESFFHRNDRRQAIPPLEVAGTHRWAAQPAT